MRSKWAAAVLPICLALAGCGQGRPDENAEAGDVETVHCEYIDCAEHFDENGGDAWITGRYIYFGGATVPKTEDDGETVGDFVRRGHEAFPDAIRPRHYVPYLYAVSQEKPTGLGGKLLAERPEESDEDILVLSIFIGAVCLVLIIGVWRESTTLTGRVAAGCVTVPMLALLAFSVWSVYHWRPTDPVYKVWFDNVANAKVRVAIDGEKVARVTETARLLVPVQFPKEQGKKARLEVWNDAEDVLMESAVIEAPHGGGLAVYNVGEKNRYRIHRQKYRVK